MTLKYKAVKVAEAGVSGGGEARWVARLTKRNTVDLDQIAEIIVNRSSLSRGDILAVITSLTEVTTELLLNNNTVQLGELGTYSLHIKARPVVAPDKVTASTIKSTSVAYRASPAMKKRMKSAQFTRRLG